jgi:ATP synthase protein I
VVPYHNPIPDKSGSAKADRSSMSSMIGAWVQAEKLMQIVLVLPSAGVIGWLAGYGLDRWLHQKWIAIAGAIFGIIAGLVGAVRMAMFYGAQSKGGNGDGSAGAGGNR